jgi:hypothetical protein
MSAKQACRTEITGPQGSPFNIPTLSRDYDYPPSVYYHALLLGCQPGWEVLKPMVAAKIENHLNIAGN